MLVRLLLILLPALLAGHPLSRMVCTVQEDGAGLILQLLGDFEDIVTFQDLLPDQGADYSVAQLQDGLRRHLVWLQGRVRLLDEAGRSLPLQVVGQAGGDLIEALDYSRLAGRSFRLDLRCADRQVVAAILYDLGAVSRGVAASLELRYPDRTGVRIVAEGLPVPLWPTAGETDVGGGYAVAEPHPAVRQSFAWLSLGGGGLRQELLLPYLALERLAGIERDDPAVVAVADRARIVERLQTALANICTVAVDGRLLTMRVTAVEFHAVATGEAADQDLPAHLTRIGVRLEAGLTTQPTEVSVSWQTFTDLIRNIRQHVDLGKGQEGLFLKDREPTASWFIALPELAPAPLAAAGAGAWLALLVLSGVAVVAGVFFDRRLALTALVLLTGLVVWVCRLSRPPADLLRVASTLQQQSYAALAQGSSAATWDVLERVAEPAVVDELFAAIDEIRRRSDGALVDVFSVTLEPDGQVRQTDRGWQVPCRWQVVASVLHWGHRHQRDMRFTGSVTLRAHGGRWRLSAWHAKDVDRLR